MEVLAQNDSGGGGAAVGVVFFLIYAAVAVVWIAGMWKMFDKGGIEGWWAIIPIANTYHLVKLSGKEWWWFLLFFVPCINFVALIVVSLALAERFGKTPAYGIGLWLLPFIFYPMTGFGDAEYQGTAEFA
jgi:hypothetical protein